MTWGNGVNNFIRFRFSNYTAGRYSCFTLHLRSTRSFCSLYTSCHRLNTTERGLLRHVIFVLNPGAKRLPLNSIMDS